MFSGLLLYLGFDNLGKKKKLKKLAIWEILKKKPGIFNNVNMFISKNSIWHK